MSGIVLSASVRQNLLSLQSTADLLSTTQNRLATGNKVNSALDNPTNFFTAQSLNSRATDINNLLDGVSNGVQILQAANTGLTSLQKLVDTAKSIANQALQTTVGYSTKSNVQATIGGATSTDLRGTTTYSSATANSNVLFNGTAGGVTAAASTTTLGGTIGTFTGTAVLSNASGTPAITSASLIYTSATAAPGALSDYASSLLTDGTTINVNGHSITFKSGAAPAAASAPAGYGIDSSGTGSVATDGNGNSLIYLGASTTSSTATVADILKAVDLASGVQNAVIASGVATLSTNTSQTASSISGGGAFVLKTSTGADLSVSGKADVLNALGLSAGATGSGTATASATRTTSSASLGTLIADGSTLNVNGKTISFKNAGTPVAANVATGSGVSGNVVTDGSGNSTVYLQKGTVADVLKAIDLATGVQTASNSSGTATVTTATGQTNSSIVAGALHISTGTASDLSIVGTGNALSVLGLTGTTGASTTFTAGRAAGAGSITGKTLTFSAFNGGTAVSVTFGDGTGGTVKTLDQLNAALQANNLGATLDSNGTLTISASNDYASSKLSSSSGGAIGGTLTSVLSFTTATAPIADAAAQTTRANLVSQYNNIMQQINTTSQDASFNGVNLLNGDQLKLTFNETGKSSLSITGVTFNAAGLGLSQLASGTDFIDNAATNRVLTSLQGASTGLRSQASALGSNLSVVQIRQDFSKNLINVLQTGSSNLTLADTNEEAANSQALSTRQSIAVSALGLANQAQQSVLRLLQ